MSGRDLSPERCVPRVEVRGWVSHGSLRLAVENAPVTTESFEGYVQAPPYSPALAEAGHPCDLHNRSCPWAAVIGRICPTPELALEMWAAGVDVPDFSKAMRDVSDISVCDLPVVRINQLPLSCSLSRTWEDLAEGTGNEHIWQLMKGLKELRGVGGAILGNPPSCGLFVFESFLGERVALGEPEPILVGSVLEPFSEQ